MEDIFISKESFTTTIGVITGDNTYLEIKGQGANIHGKRSSPNWGGYGKTTGENPVPTFIAPLKRTNDVVSASPGTLLADSETALPHFPGTPVPDARAPRGMLSLEAPTEVPGMVIPYTHIPVSRYYDLLRGIYVWDEFIHQLSTELVGFERRLEEQREASLVREKELLVPVRYLGSPCQVSLRWMEGKKSCSVVPPRSKRQHFLLQHKTTIAYLCFVLEQEVSPLTSGRHSRSSGPLNGGESCVSSTDSLPLSPSEIDDFKGRFSFILLR
ncbi:hypothetical protein NE237_010728 [Protea cynaroides]|uniref:Uncharacterized protein n=1 Tax=Protea cynaroides TaxID=273540 RepID=A0A9Q0R1J3_9MAGN|nr:hypothetical protein NE237_010728 [Protea cynaroides]